MEILRRLWRAVLRFFVRSAKRLPVVQKRIQRESTSVLDSLRPKIKPYDKTIERFRGLPSQGLERSQVLNLMKEMKLKEDPKWREGWVSGAVYHGDPQHIEFLNQAYSLYSQTNPLHSDLWPSVTKMEAEIVAMTGKMLSFPGAAGTVTSGGTESILLAIKTYRDRARIENPELVVPITAHAAFQKAAQYFGIKLVRVDVDSQFRAHPEKMKAAVTENTIALIGSAPSFPHGVIDPIPELAQIAQDKNIPFHTDACLGGFILPFARQAGVNVTDFDFQVPGVTSISVDTHKYGYAPKGTSVLLFRNKDLRHDQFFKTTDWPGGLYFSPTFAGSRPGALSAACWAALLSVGEAGYAESAKAILKTAENIKAGIAEIPEIEIMGQPLWVLAFQSKTLNIYQVMDRMSEKGWNLNGLHKPACFHLCVTLRHVGGGVAQRFVQDLKASVEAVKNEPARKGGMAPVYGMAASLPDETIVEDLLDGYLDLLYEA